MKKIRRIRKFRIPPFKRDRAGYYYRTYPVAYIKGRVRDFFNVDYKDMILKADAKKITGGYVTIRYIGVEVK